MTVLDKKEVKIGQAVVTNNVSQAPIYQNTMMPPVQTVNISFKYDGRDITFNGANANGFSAEEIGSGLVICENENALLAEIRAFNKAKRDVLSQRERDEKIVAWCEEQESRLDPVKQAEASSKQQIEAIKKEFGEIVTSQNTKIDTLTNSVNALLQALGTKKGKE